ncbi:MAG: hypothetical protein U9R29_03105 [Thermodesulfobacteriota bacterium]|nr:hypothetical protein [Thermodesulfobacteriota bacterium]
MGDLLFVVLVVVGLATFFYRKSKEHVVQESCSVSDDTVKSVVEDVQDPLQHLVVQRVTESPGILQTELYKLFPHDNSKHLQTMLLQLDKENILRRDKDGNSYRLFPI